MQRELVLTAYAFWHISIETQIEISLGLRHHGLSIAKYTTLYGHMCTDIYTLKMDTCHHTDTSQKKILIQSGSMDNFVITGQWSCLTV